MIFLEIPNVPLETVFTETVTYMDSLLRDTYNAHKLNSNLNTSFS